MNTDNMNLSDIVYKKDTKGSNFKRTLENNWLLFVYKIFLPQSFSSAINVTMQKCIAVFSLNWHYQTINDIFSIFFTNLRPIIVYERHIPIVFSCCLSCVQYCLILNNKLPFNT